MVYHGIVCYDIVLSFVDDVVVVILSDWRNISAGPSENLKMSPAWPCLINTSRLHYYALRTYLIIENREQRLGTRDARGGAFRHLAAREATCISGLLLHFLDSDISKKMA